VAATYTRRLTGVVTEVVPVAGLLAQTALGDEFTERDTALVRQLAAVEPAALDRALYSPDDFLRWADGPLSADQRQRVFALLGRYGITVAVAAASGGATGTSALLGELRRASGIDPLLDHLRRRFVDAADRLRAATALGALDAAAADHGPQLPPAPRAAMAELRAGVAGVRRHPLMRQQDLAPALADLAGGRLVLAERDAAALVALATGTTTLACLALDPGTPPATAADAAAAQAAHWRRLEFTAASRPLQRHARTAREVCEAFLFDTRP
jgi:hypothetical protein